MSEENLNQNSENVNSEIDNEAMNELFAQRLAKVKELRDNGIDPFGERFDDVEMVEACRAKYNPEAPEDVEQSAIVAGRLTAMRLMGKSIFADLKDSSGRIQLYVGKNTLGDEKFNFFKKLDIGDIVGVHGNLFTTRTGELSVKVKDVKLLSKSLRALPEKFHGLTNVEQRYRQRYLDLIMNDDSRRIFKQRIAIIREIRKFMEERGFLEVETPMLQPLAGGASANPFKTYYEALNAPMYMRIAPEL
ncbi:MAG: lysine--tRNA ligase, partial [Lentisphaeria bacterium]|nr:lysine--tRNA ligase [Lentisphaeria bacterium]